MVTYNVAYKKGLFWRILRNVTGDWVLPENPVIRVFDLAGGERVEIPMLSTIFIYSKERIQSIADRVSKEIGHDVKPEKR